MREAGVRSPNASHQTRKTWEVCASHLGIYDLGKSTSLFGVSIMVWVIHFCSPVTELAPKTVGHRSFGPNKTGPDYLVTHYTCMHHRIQHGDMTMGGWKTTLSLMHPPPSHLFFFFFFSNVSLWSKGWQSGLFKTGTDLVHDNMITWSIRGSMRFQAYRYVDFIW